MNMRRGRCGHARGKIDCVPDRKRRDGPSTLTSRRADFAVRALSRRLLPGSLFFLLKKTLTGSPESQTLEPWLCTNRFLMIREGEHERHFVSGELLCTYSLTYGPYER